MLTTNVSVPSFARVNSARPRFGHTQSVTGYRPTLKQGLQADTISLTSAQKTPGIKFAGTMDDIKNYFQNLPEGTEKTVKQMQAELPSLPKSRGTLRTYYLKP